MTKIVHLPNGLTTVTEERPGTGKVSMQIYIRYGTQDEKLNENGLTYLAQEACNGGTKTRSRDALAEEIENRGGQLGTTASRDVTVFSATALTRYTEETFDILADLVRNPAFDAREVEKTKTQIAEWIEQQNQSAATQARLKFYEALYADQPGGLNPMGSEEMLSSFTAEQVKQKYAEILSDPSRIVISFSGDITATEAEAMTAKFFGDLPAATQAAPSQPPVFTGGDIRESNNNDQLNLTFGFDAPGQDDDDRFAVLMLEEALSGGMSSPLFQEIREKRSLVYSVGAGYSAQPGTGTFLISAGTGRGQAHELMTVTFDLLGDVIRNGFDQDTLDHARERILRGIRNACEDAGTAGTRNARQLLSFGRIVPESELAERLKNVTPDDIRRVMASMLSKGTYALAAIGPQDGMPSAQEIKTMIKKQVDGVVLPPAPARTPFKPHDATVATTKETPASATPKITTLKNGMKVMTLERPGSLACGAWVGAGSDHETPELNGATHMNEHMMFKGTPSYGPGEIDKIIETELGGDLNAYTNKDRTAYYFYSLEPDALEKVVDICGEMVFEALIDEGEYAGTAKHKGERAVVLEEIKRANDNVGNRLFDTLCATAFPDSPHSRPILGTKESLMNISSKDLIAYRDAFYVPNNVVFSAVGPINHDDFVAVVERKYGHLQPRDIEPLPVPAYKGGTAIVEMEAAQTCNLYLTSKGVSMTHADSAAYQVLSLILGSGGSSRLHRETVVNRELCAGVHAGTIEYYNCGQFYIHTKVKAENAKAFISSAYNELRRLADDLTEAELDKAKAGLEMDLLSSIETNNNACDTHAANTLGFGRLVPPSEISAAVQKLTIDDIRRVAKDVLACNPTLAIVAPKGTDPKLLPTHDEVVAMRDGKPPKKPDACPKGPAAA